MEHFFETTAGTKIKIQPIAMLDLQLAQNAVEREFRSRGEPIDPPTYEIETVGGDKEIFNHNEETIRNASPEEKAGWERHIEATTRMGLEIQERTALVFLEGACIELPSDDGWAKRRERLFGEKVPEDLEQMKLYYVNNVLLKTPADKAGLMLAIQRLSLTGANEEAIEAMESLFRSQVEKQNRAGVAALKTLTQKTESMVLQPNFAGRASSESMENDPRAISATKRRRPGRNTSR